MTAVTSEPSLIPWARDDGHPPSPLGSNPVIFRRRSTGFDERTAPRSLMAPVNPQSRELDDPDLCNISFGDGFEEDELILGSTVRSRESRRPRDDITSLVEFLKNHEPPPDNFMSIPYNFDDDKDHGKWSKFKVARKRSKSMPKTPKNIRLPDSAISGVTTGGHRHIAISIPLEAMPVGDLVKSQYPIHGRKEKGKLEPRREPTKQRDTTVRTYTTLNGVVTVIRPTEREEPPISQHPAFTSRPVVPSSSHQQPYANKAAVPSQKFGGQLTTSSGVRSRLQEYVGALPDRIDTPHASEYVTARGGPNNDRQRSSDRHGQSDFQRSAYPARGSSITARRHPQQFSIDGMINLYGDVKNIPSDYSQKPLPKPPTSNQESSADLAAKPLKTKALLPSPISERPEEELTSNRGSKISLIITDPPITAASQETSRPSTQGSMQSRREKVRDKKRRDMEVLRTARLKAQNQSDKGHQGSEDSGQATPTPQSPNVSSSPLSNRHVRSMSENSLCPIMVVVDVEPSLCSPDESVDSKRPESLPLPQTMGKEQQPRGTDVEESRRSRQSKEALLDQRIMRLYDSYRENRMRDVERRVRRLERNGDIWLRALIPVLDDMNHNINPRRRETTKENEIREYASDDDASGAMAERRSRNAERRVHDRRSLSGGRLIDGLIRKKAAAEDSEWSDAVSNSDDMSGLGSIEPLMRELAGEARRRQKRISSRLDSGQYGGQ